MQRSTGRVHSLLTPGRARAFAQFLLNSLRERIELPIEPFVCADVTGELYSRLGSCFLSYFGPQQLDPSRPRGSRFRRVSWLEPLLSIAIL